MSKVIVIFETSDPSNLVRLLQKKNVQIENSVEQYEVMKVEIKL